ALIRNPDCEIRTITDLLGKLPEGFMSTYTLMYRSRSLQGPNEIDYLNPRALVYQNNLVISFNNDISQAGHNSIEAVAINPKAPNVKDMFQYSEIMFPYHETEVGNLSWQEVQAGIKVSEPNSVHCTACHGVPARPIFPGYPDWEGAFGSIGKELASDAEVKGYWQFHDRLNGAEPSRYQKLKPIPSRPEGAVGYSDEQYPVANILADNNENLNRRLGHVNGLRVGRLILQTSNYEKFRYALAGAMLECENWISFLPTQVKANLMANIETRYNLRSKWTKEQMDQFTRQIYETDRQFQFATDVQANDPNNFDGSPWTRRSYDEFIKRFAKRYGRDQDYRRLFLDTVKVQGIDRGDQFGAELRLIMQGQGIEIDQWFLDLTQPTYRFQDGENVTEAVLSALLKGDKGFDEQIKSEIRIAVEPASVHDYQNARNDLPRFCHDLRVASNKALQGVRIPKINPQPSITLTDYPSSFKNTCATCHGGEALGCSVTIPFDDQNQMTIWLQQGDHLNKIRSRVFSQDETFKMPPTSFLTGAELDNIKAYLSKF
ncbi:MAG: hypothetical protein ACXVA9_04045, partial [Bdellovibrionales bacterium]